MLELKEAGKILFEGQRIALTAHVSPDGDAIGSTLGLARVLTVLGKEVTVFVDDIIKGFNFCPDVKKIKNALDLEQIREPLLFDVLCVLDCSTLDRIGAVAEKVNGKKVLNIDHHVSNGGFAEYTFIDATAAATAQLIGELVQLMQWPLDAWAANYLYLGLSTDSGSFSYSNTTARALNCGAFLVTKGARPEMLSEALAVTPKLTMEQLQVVLPTLTYAFGGRVAYIYLDYAHYNQDAVTESFINLCRNIEGVQVAVFFKEVEKETVRVSMRSCGPDLAEIAKSFGGGGHHRAAGCTVQGALSEVIGQVLNKIGQELE